MIHINMNARLRYGTANHSDCPEAAQKHKRGEADFRTSPTFAAETGQLSKRT